MPQPLIRGDRGPDFSGPMPAPPAGMARAEANLVVAKGNETLRPANMYTGPYVGAPVGVLAHAWPNPAPRTLTLGSAGAPYGAAGTSIQFPPDASLPTPFGFPLNGWAGLVDSAGNQWGHPIDIFANLANLACVLEYGSESSYNKVFFDWEQGSYNLPPCNFVRVSALAWGTGWTVNGVLEFPLRASVSLGNLQGAMVPTVTGSRLFAAAETSSLAVPNGARAFDVSSEDILNTVTATTSSDAQIVTRDYATPNFTPGWTPIALGAGNGVAVTSQMASRVGVKFWLEL